ncbi:hypothetical protein HK102_003085, partial [Quaeritorhiza haematococci]
MEGRHCVVQKLDTRGGQQNVKFLRKTGLFKIMMLSKTAFAERFQDWVADVITAEMMRSKTAFAERFQDWVADVITEIQETRQYQLQRWMRPKP